MCELKPTFRTGHHGLEDMAPRYLLNFDTRDFSQPKNCENRLVSLPIGRHSNGQEFKPRYLVKVGPMAGD